MLFIRSVTACACAFLVALIAAHLELNDLMRTALVADVTAYEEIGSAILDGNTPYVPLAIEHLPVALVPMVALVAISSTVGVNLYSAWVLAMAASFVGSVLLFDRIGRGKRFLLIALPLLPLALFRIEPWVVLLTVGGLVGYGTSRFVKGSIWTILATAAKGWPIALAAIPWILGRKTLALGTAAVSAVVLLAVAATPGFREAREFSGIHSETVLGGIVLMWRYVSGAEPGVIGAAGAMYIEAGSWSVLVNALPGIAILAACALAMSRRPSDFETAVSITGLAVLAIMLASPLLSTQFLFWLVPFIALGRKQLDPPYLVAAVAGLVAVTVFYPAQPWWAFVVTVKNVALITLAWIWAKDLLGRGRQDHEHALSAGSP